MKSTPLEFFTSVDFIRREVFIKLLNTFRELVLFPSPQSLVQARCLWRTPRSRYPCPTPEYGNRTSSPNVVFFNSLVNTRRWIKSRNPRILIATHYSQYTAEFRSTPFLMKISTNCQEQSIEQKQWEEVIMWIAQNLQSIVTFYGRHLRTDFYRKLSLFLLHCCRSQIKVHV
jgi:hypothetical protein